MFIGLGFLGQAVSQPDGGIGIQSPNRPATGADGSGEHVRGGSEKLPHSFAAIRKAGQVDAVGIDAIGWVGEHLANQCQDGLGVPTVRVDQRMVGVCQRGCAARACGPIRRGAILGRYDLWCDAVTSERGVIEVISEEVG